MRAALLFFLIASASAYGAEAEIDVVALFRDAALLEINGERQLLKRGEKSKEGFLLVRANSREAVIEIDGRRLMLDLTSRIGTNYEPATASTVSINLNNLGQYMTVGAINERPVPLLVDTGANIVAINTRDARTLGLDFEQAGNERIAVTAGGEVKSWEVLLDSVQVGSIRVSNVRAAVLEGDYPETILLGMTFLTNVKMREDQGVLVLTSKL